MLDIKFIQDNVEQVKDACQKKGADVDIDALLSLYKEKKELQNKSDEFKSQKNTASKEIVNLSDDKKEAVLNQMKNLDTQADEVNAKRKDIESTYQDLLLKVPNIISEDTPEGKDESENVIARSWGEQPSFDFKPKDHIELGTQHDLIDLEKAAQITGSRFGYLKNEAALIQFALVHFAFDVLTQEHHLEKAAAIAGVSVDLKPFIPIVPPVMIRPEVFTRMARLTDEDKDERYHIQQDDLYLIGSAEHTLGPIHMDEQLSQKDLPLRYVGYSTSFRREAGSYGKDTKGIIRMHQFDKIEMLSFSSPENSIDEQNFFVGIQEYLLQSLEIPYQVMQICTGDMGKPDFRQIDINSYMPGQDAYRETHTSDLMTDYQTRRLKTKIKETKEFAHTNDATVFAIGRTLIAILENNQQKDGSIKIPEILQPYMNGITHIGK